MVTRPAYRYAARLVRMVDADTYVLRIDAGFHVHVETHVRLNGWNCPERRDPLGPAATAAAEQILKAASQIIVETAKDTQTFGRWVGAIFVDGRELGVLLEQRGLATRA